MKVEIFEVNEEKCKKIIDYLNHYKKQFLNEEQIEHCKKHGIIEIRDYLDGISEENKTCFISYLFKDLNENEKQYIIWKINFDVNFEEFYSTYYL